MARIIPFPGDPHEQVQTLLPWYVSGTLDDAEAAMVDAHVAECGRCRAELEAERALRSGLASVALDPDQGWSRMRASIASRERNRSLRPRGFFGRRIALGWAVAAPLAIAAIGLVGALSMSNPWSEPRYHALGSAPAAPDGNAIILFRAEADVAELRAALDSVDGRVVDGPTTSGAWIVRVPADRRSAALARLRARPTVVLAEPLDADGPG